MKEDHAITIVAALKLSAAHKVDERITANSTTPDLGATALVMVCTQGRVDDAKLLIELGKADVNLVAQSASYDGSSPVMAAARNGHADIVTMLLDSGADLDATTTTGYMDEFDGRWGHNEEIVKGERIRTALSLQLNMVS